MFSEEEVLGCKWVLEHSKRTAKISPAQAWFIIIYISYIISLIFMNFLKQKCTSLRGEKSGCIAGR